MMIEDLSFSDPGEEYEGVDYDDTSFLASPTSQGKSQDQPLTSGQETAGHDFAKKTSHSQKGGRRLDQNDLVAKETALRAELATLKTMNGHLSTVIQSLDGATRASMHTVNASVGQSSALLDTWTRILAATEHNQRLILDSRWHGAGEDAAVIAAEEERREEERRLRREADERRKAERERKAEEDRIRREAGASGINPASATSARGQPGYRGRTGSTNAPPPRGTVTGVRGTRGGVRGGSATANGRGISRTGSVNGSRARSTVPGVGRIRGRGA